MVPATVTTATDHYFETQDTFGEWLATACETGDPLFSGSGSELFASWSDYAKASHIDEGTIKGFSERLTKRGFPRRRTKRERRYEGIRLRTGFDEDEEEDVKCREG